MTQTGTVYQKPYGKTIFGTETICHYAYLRENLIAEPIFPYFVLDGGAYHFAYDHYPCPGKEGMVDSNHLLDLTMSGKLFQVFDQAPTNSQASANTPHVGETTPRLDTSYHWEKSFAYVQNTPFRKKYEWQIWPQRLYMTIPLAHAFLRTGDRCYADKWLAIVSGWDKAHPYQSFDPAVHYIHTDMTWRDMQVAWRSLSLLHGIFMLQDAPFTEAEWRYLYSFIELHLRHLYTEALDRLSRQHAQNHVLQIGVALLMGGLLFPEWDGADDMVRVGKATVEMNMQKAVYPDGGSNEDSPSYNHFIVRLYLEALLLLERNGKAPIPGLRESIVRQYEWIYQCCAPDGKCLQISDSYSMDAMADLHRAEALLPLDFPHVKRSVLFPDSRMAVLRMGKMTLFADAMEWLAGHQHVGRPQILLYYGDHPVLVDSGCCNYDRWEFYLAQNANKMHNVLWCPAFDEKKCKIDPRVTAFDAENGVVQLTTTVIDEKGSYTWTRRLHMDAHSLTIEDRAVSDIELPWRTRLFFCRNDTHTPDCFTFQQLTEDYWMTLTTDQKIETELVPVMNDENRIDYAVVIEASGHGKCFMMQTKLGFADRT